MYKLFLKRIFDLFFSGIICILLVPLFIITYVAVKSDSNGDFLYIQERLGKKGYRFKLFKIRTMIDVPRISDKEILKGNREVTRVGSLLRRFKIDELPQILNILKGDMSFVGPRPCLPALQKDFNEDGRMRTKVKPGLTGLAQTNGNIYLTWEERWKYDRHYVENITIFLDIKIVLKTALIVFMGEELFLNKPNV
jgi:lipopolysaccharide/colanic/teichoic acid biosynthesis glycosyltransferase